jgi:hypothetical protein
VCSDVWNTFPLLWRKGGDIDQAHQVGNMASDVADDAAAIGMGNQDRGTGEGGQRLLRRGDILLESREWNLDGERVIPVGLEQGDPLAPARGIHVGPMHEHDIGPCPGWMAWLPFP